MPAKRVSRKGSIPSDATFRGERRFSPADLAKIRPHVINLRAGKFLSSGEFTTSAADMDAIFSKHLPASKKSKVLFWAHGGLVSDDQALRYVMDHVGGWMSAGIYPIYFIWRTDIWTTLRDRLFGIPRVAERALGDFLADRSDALLEGLFHTPAVEVWSQIKEYARLSFEEAGGGLVTAGKLGAFAKANPGVKFYACGHSAGAVFHAWFLPVAIDAGVHFDDLFLLAPAVTTADFMARLAPRIGAGKGIAHSTLFTMNETAELADNCLQAYRKSLLYFVSRTCEPEQPTPILGLEESLQSVAPLRDLFGIQNPSPSAEVVWSPNRVASGIAASNSTSHGGFDNDSTTLNSIVRRIRGDDSLDVFEPEIDRSFEMKPMPQDTPASRAARPPRKRALCIGIDEYAASPLFGCVNDAKEWRSVLKARGFETELLTNGQATRAGLIRAITDLIEGSRPGDVLVLQYAGHGTHLDDVDGDENDGQDEALVPFDYLSGNFLIDDDLGDLLDHVPPGVNLTCFMDCCHSGTNTRLLAIQNLPKPGERTRYLAVPRDVVRKHIVNRKNAPRSRPRSVFTGRPEVSFAACRPDQTAKELDGHGYFTLAATRILRRAGRKELTHKEFLDRVKVDFPLPASSQEPQLNCDDVRQTGVLLAATDGEPARASEAASPAASVPTTSATTTPAAGDARLLLETLHDAMHILRKWVGE